MAPSTATLSNEGQLSIPKDLRDRLQLSEGTQVTLTVSGDEIRIRKADTWQQLRGLLAKSEPDALKALHEERELDLQVEARHSKGIGSSAQRGFGSPCHNA